MQSVYAIDDGEKFIIEEKIEIEKGQRFILTLLDREEIPVKDEAEYSYATAINSDSFDYPLQEGEEEYSINDCKIKFK